jgi:hypothetical protein
MNGPLLAFDCAGRFLGARGSGIQSHRPTFENIPSAFPNGLLIRNVSNPRDQRHWFGDPGDSIGLDGARAVG